MKPLDQCLLYAFVDTAFLHGRPPETVAQQLCDGGADLIQLRAKGSAPAEIRRLAEAILPITRRAGVGLVINDHLAIAQELGAELCHLGQEDFFTAGYTHVSQLKTGAPMAKLAADASPSPRGEGRGEGELGPDVSGPRIGLSTHSPAQAERALAAAADYIAIGPVYATGTKPDAKPVTLDYVRWAAANVRIPWFAIGGINLENLDEVLAAGARRICVVSAILNAPDIAGVCRKFKQRLVRVAQVSQPAVSPISNRQGVETPGAHEHSHASQAGSPAIQQIWKSALRQTNARLQGRARR